MRILKKSLACLLVAIIAATAMFGCLVSAEEAITGTITVSDVTVDDTSAETIELPVIVATDAPISVARVKVNVPAALGTIVSATVSDYEGLVAPFTDEKAEDTTVDEDYNPEKGIFLVAAKDWSIGFSYAEITLTIALADTVTYGTYAITAENITDVEGADWSENPCTFEIESGVAIVPYMLNLDGDNTVVTLAAGASATVMGSIGGYVGVVEATGTYTIDYNGEAPTEDFQFVRFVTPSFVVKNTSEAEITVTFKHYIPVIIGSMDTPEVIPADTVSKDYAPVVEEGSQGYYYSFTAPEAGTVSVKMNDEQWTYKIDNMTSYIYGDIQWSDSDPVVNPGTVEVAAGDEIVIMVNSYTAGSWTAPAGTVNWTFSFTKATVEPEYSLTVTADPVAGNTTFMVRQRYTYTFTGEAVSYGVLAWRQAAYEAAYNAETGIDYATCSADIAISGIREDGYTTNGLMVSGIALPNITEVFYTIPYVVDVNGDTYYSDEVISFSYKDYLIDRMSTGSADVKAKVNAIMDLYYSTESVAVYEGQEKPNYTFESAGTYVANPAKVVEDNGSFTTSFAIAGATKSAALRVDIDFANAPAGYVSKGCLVYTPDDYANGEDATVDVTLSGNRVEVAGISFFAFTTQYVFVPYVVDAEGNTIYGSTLKASYGDWLVDKLNENGTAAPKVQAMVDLSTLLGIDNTFYTVG